MNAILSTKAFKKLLEIYKYIFQIRQVQIMKASTMKLLQMPLFFLFNLLCLLTAASANSA